MDENRITGAVRNVEGKIEDAVGGFTGDTRTKIEGKLDQGAGNVQSTFGRAIDEFGGPSIADRASSFVKQATAAGENTVSVVQDAVQKSGAQASDVGVRLYDEGRRAGQSIGRAVEEQPLAAVFVAAALGYGTAYLVHRR
jgi:uncharacterized protein YjbJ (UPF0337 family)/ElaB/YqjD/DUF883 family membrane-anchored ribosome-binding protein